MSVVNKMLQDLEARQTQPDEVNADYQPPQKKQSKLLVGLLLILAIAAIFFALSDKIQLFKEDTNNQITTVEQTPPAAVIKKMTVVAEQMQLEPLVASVQRSKNETELVVTEPASVLPNNLIDNETALLQEPVNTSSTLPTAAVIVPQNSQQSISDSTTLNSNPPAKQKSSFSMTGSNQKNSSSSLKQRIAESLNNDNLELSQVLLSELLETEPNNIKARKKLASLLFAQGSYARSRQLLQEGIELHPSQSDLRLMLARLYVVQKDPSEALNILLAFQPLVDNQAEYLAYRAALAQQLKQAELAKSDYHSLTSIDSSNAKWWLGLAIARDQLGEIKMAVQAYRRANSLSQLDGAVNDFIQQRISVLAGAQ